MKITREVVQHVAALAHLELSEEELVRMERDLSSVLQYVEQLNQLDTAGVEPMAQVTDPARPERPDPMRPDRQESWFSQAEALANAPLTGSGYFKVPRVINQS